MDKAYQKRKNITKQAIANQKLEGLTVSNASKKISENYVVGKVSAKDAAAKIKARYGAI